MPGKLVPLLIALCALQLEEGQDPEVPEVVEELGVESPGVVVVVASLEVEVERPVVPE